MNVKVESLRVLANGVAVGKIQHIYETRILEPWSIAATTRRKLLQLDFILTYQVSAASLIMCRRCGGC